MNAGVKLACKPAFLSISPSDEHPMLLGRRRRSRRYRLNGGGFDINAGVKLACKPAFLSISRCLNDEKIVEMQEKLQKYIISDERKRWIESG